MQPNGIIHSGLSGKKFTNSVSARAFTRRTRFGVMGPPLMTSTTSGRHEAQARSSSRRIHSW